ncbi:desmoglein-2 [Rhineura floridana]|uniref:desmoglein-2 n=1 Tax=Rhineura floridana TaxID=261503 RepID=UPI002AC7F50D|nr:desmoglein-2 [Rhineura floridana]
MAWHLGSGGLGILLLLNCVIFGNGLDVEILGGRNDQRHHMDSHIRQKREWIVPPAVIWEERDNSNRNPIAKIRSDRELDSGVIITYTISGPGVTEPPYHLFVINGKTGELNITRVVDREKTPMFHVKGYALDQHGNNMEKPLDLRIKVLDINDNRPVFSQEVFVGSVEELCEVGTLVMKISATDADEPNTLNSKIAFKLISQDPSYPPAFEIIKGTGEVRTSRFQLDREVQSSYSLTIEARDRDGHVDGNGQQTTVQIKVLDVNDNIPVFEKTLYEGSVKENTANVEIMRMKVFDDDEQFTDNWLANFTFVSGNEGGYFRIETDSQTNEGILTLVKEINYEELQHIDLNIVVSNKAAYHKSIITQGIQAKPIPVKIKVENVREGPVFKPQTMIIKTSETMKVSQVIGRFQAYDEDTGKIAEHIRYAKDRDIANWFTIDSKTAEIKLIRVPDYESSFIVNGSYTATILAISNDQPAKTATGTIVIQVEDTNDHCPTVVTPRQNVCTDAKFINITVEDRDAHPNGGPFTFTIIDGPERMSDKWIIGRVDGSRAQLIPQDVKQGIYDLQLLVKDNQGFSCPEHQIVRLDVCECAEGGGCQGRSIGSSVMLGPGAIALIILALLLLLLVPLLLLACGLGSHAKKGFAAIPDNSEEMLRNWNSEGAAPEDKAILNLMTPVDNSALMVGSGAAGLGTGGAVGGGSSSSAVKEHYSNAQTVERRWEEQRALLSGAGYGGVEVGGASAMAGGGTAAGKTMTMGTGRSVAMEAAGVTNEEFLRSYFTEKADAFADEDEGHLAKDCLLVYSQEEERESLHGSVGCCSFIEEDFDDRFLDDLGDKFKTLAEICMGKRIGTEAGLHSSQALKDWTQNPAAKESGVQYLHQKSAEHTYTSGSSYQVPEPMKGFGSEAVTEETVTETTFAPMPDMQPVRPIPNPMVSSSNVVVTETSYGASPPPVTFDPQFKENVVVTERVLAPASNLLEMPTGVFPDLPDSKYVVVRERERVLVPSSELKGSLSIPNLSEGQNVVITERVVTPTPGMWSTTEQAIYPDSDRQEQILISDPFFNQASTQEAVPPGSTLSKSSRVKYSSVQYTCS